MDIFVQLRKADATGKILRNVNIPLADLKVSSESEVELVNTLVYLGPTGILRASRRALDPKPSKPHWPVQSHDRSDKVPPGRVVRLEIGIWPSGIMFEPDEKLVLKVAGHQMTLAEFPPLRGAFQVENRGRHVVHLGGAYDSHVIIPLVEL